MFQFRAFPSGGYLIHRSILEYCSYGFPHSDIHGSSRMCRSPWLFAACHVLLRLLMPRHSPCALLSLTCSRISLMSSQSRLRGIALCIRKILSLPPQTRFAGLCGGDKIAHVFAIPFARHCSLHSQNSVASAANPNCQVCAGFSVV